jgi:hypothetical protein
MIGKFPITGEGLRRFKQRLFERLPTKASIQFRSLPEGVPGYTYGRTIVINKHTPPALCAVWMCHEYARILSGHSYDEEWAVSLALIYRVMLCDEY